MTMITMIIASTSVIMTSRIESLMNSVKSATTLPSSPSGSCDLISGMAWRTRPMTSIELAVGSTKMPTKTPVSPLNFTLEL